MNSQPVRYAFILLLLHALTCQSAAAADADAFLGLAEDAGRWIASTAVASEDGSIWPDDANAPDTIGYDLASGVAGKVVFFVALYRATGNDVYLDEARRGADFLAAAVTDPTTFDSNP